MKPIRRVFLIVLDSFGVGNAPDAGRYGDQGSNTLKACYSSGHLAIPFLESMGIYHLPQVDCKQPVGTPIGAYARMQEASAGKDTTIGHWEIAGIISQRPMPTYPHGFPEPVIQEFQRRTGRGVLCNRPYSGTQVIRDYGRQHEQTGDLIVYTSADSVFQVAAHEAVVPVEELYRCCQIAREILTGEHGVGRVIARPFVGSWPEYTRTANRHDFSLEPTGPTFLDALMSAGLDTLGVGKIYDIFAGRGISETVRTVSNDDGMEKTLARARRSDWRGVCFVNLVDFDMLYGHRNDVAGYTEALNRADAQLQDLYSLLGDEDILMITADHGCDPSTSSTDHSRECTPFLLCGRPVRSGVDLGTRPTFADIGKTVAALFGIDAPCDGTDLSPLFLR